MSDTVPIQLARLARAVPERVFFNARELRTILQLYGRMVQAGEWRDYAIDASSDRAVFSVYRRARTAPLYRIEKQPQLASRQGQYAILGASGQILKRGRELPLVLRLLERKLFRLIGADPLR